MSTQTKAPPAFQISQIMQEMGKEHSMTTTKASHTPGPWYIIGRHIGDGADDIVQIMEWDAPHLQEQLANARLITAAPEMGELLLRLYDLHPYAEIEPVLKKAGLL